MKVILYAAAALMIAAGIYGFIDYSKTSRTGEFQNLYDEKKEEMPVVNEEQTIEDEVIVPAVSHDERPAAVKEEPVKKEVKKTTAKKKVKKPMLKRKLSYKSFSRAPLRDEVIEIPKVKKMEEEGQEKGIQ